MWKKFKSEQRIKKSTAKLNAIKNAKEAVAEEITASEHMSYEKFSDDPAEAKKTLIKRVLTYSLISVALIVSVILLATKCSKDTSPYPGYAEEGYNVSIKFDANGSSVCSLASMIPDTRSAIRTA